MITPSSQGTLSSLCPSSSSSQPSAAAPSVVSVTPMIHTTHSNGVATAPVYEFTPPGSASNGHLSLTTIDLGMDVMCYVPSTSDLCALGSSYLLPALKQQLGIMERLLLEQPAAVAIHSYHFQPPGLNHHITCCYPMLGAAADIIEQKLMPLRQQLHRLLGLPSNVPTLRFANALDFHQPDAASEANGKAAARLRNVHAALTPPGMLLTLTACGVL